jgi:hypothetical protein
MIFAPSVLASFANKKKVSMEVAEKQLTVVGERIPAAMWRVKMPSNSDFGTVSVGCILGFQGFD